MNFHNDTIRITNEDNMQLMARYPDKYFELAIIDPPYGIIGRVSLSGGGKTKNRPTFMDNKKMIEWDKRPPQADFFKELFRVSKNQIICGANNFSGLPPTRGFVIWDKGKTAPSYAQYDYFWTSFNELPKLADIRLFKGFLEDKTGSFHATPKPIALYKWLLSNYAKAGDKILDTHLGSGSIAIACADLGFDLTACELDTDYFNAAAKRLQTHLNQAQLFQPAEVRKLESDNSPQLF